MGVRRWADGRVDGLDAEKVDGWVDVVVDDVISGGGVCLAPNSLICAGPKPRPRPINNRYQDAPGIHLQKANDFT